MKPTNGKGGGDRPAPTGTRYEILETTDASEYSAELKAHYRDHLVPFLRRVIPNGAGLEVNFLSDPVRVEIRRRVTTR